MLRFRCHSARLTAVCQSTLPFPFRRRYKDLRSSRHRFSQLRIRDTTVFPTHQPPPPQSSVQLDPPPRSDSQLVSTPTGLGAIPGRIRRVQLHLRCRASQPEPRSSPTARLKTTVSMTGSTWNPVARLERQPIRFTSRSDTKSGLNRGLFRVLRDQGPACSHQCGPGRASLVLDLSGNKTSAPATIRWSTAPVGGTRLAADWPAANLAYGLLADP